MKGDIFLCLCRDCKDFFIGREFRHVMYYCPKCNKNGVDIEEHYSRMVGNCIILHKIRLTKKDQEVILNEGNKTK